LVSEAGLEERTRAGERVMHRYEFSRTLSSWEAMQIERAIETNGGRVIITGYSVTGAIACAEDIEPILRQMMIDVRVSESWETR
jgi:hypothetical protein